MGINYTSIVNRINYLPEKVLCSKKWQNSNRDILKKSGNNNDKKRLKSNTCSLVKNIKRTRNHKIWTPKTIW